MNPAHHLAFTTPTPLPTHRTTMSQPPTQSPLRPTRPAVATLRTRRSENVPGDLFVDSSCIDCDTCRWLAKDTFSEHTGQSAVHTQPTTEPAKLHAQLAVAACPTGSIRNESPSPHARTAVTSFPLPVSAFFEDTPVPDIYYNGFASSSTFGAASWLIIHRAGPAPYAVIFDCPRFMRRLAENIRRLTADVGGVKYIVLSHRDDVAGHAEWAEALGATRVIHRAECNSRQRTDECEVQLTDDDFPYQLGDGTELLHTPGHTKGSICMLHRPTESLFTGDHFAYSAREEALEAFSQYCGYSYETQLKSVEMLAEVPFLHMWPGHGRHFHFSDAEDRRRKIGEAVVRLSGKTARRL